MSNLSYRLEFKNYPTISPAARETLEVHYAIQHYVWNERFCWATQKKSLSIACLSGNQNTNYKLLWKVWFK